MNMTDKYNKEIAIAVLHYKTAEETREFLISAKRFFPGIRILVIDNGSIQKGANPFSDLCSDMVTVFYTGENLGFARGFNRGLTVLRKEGYKNIICSNNDILFKSDQTIPSLLKILEDKNVGAAGPSIISLKGRDQNPLLKKRPSPQEAQHMVDYYSDFNIWSRYILNRYILSPIKRIIRRNKTVTVSDCAAKTQSQMVYALNGAFFVLGEPFFERYKELDPHTFLYAEELILGEMLYKANLQACYDPSSAVLHKEDRTTSLIYGGEDRIAPAKIAQASIRHWYCEHYNKS